MAQNHEFEEYSTNERMVNMAEENASQPQDKIKIGEDEYSISELNQQQKHIVLQINLVRTRIRNLSLELEQNQVALNSFAATLENTLQTKKKKKIG